jgi:hypothetical protein
MQFTPQSGSKFSAIQHKYGYPPDLQDAAVQTVLKQAELICADADGTT